MSQHTHKLFNFYIQLYRRLGHIDIWPVKNISLFFAEVSVAMIGSD